MPGQRFAFVLRLWTEADADRRAVLRGSLQRVDSEQVRHFRSLAEVPALVRELMAQAPQPPQIGMGDWEMEVGD